LPCADVIGHIHRKGKFFVKFDFWSFPFSELNCFYIDFLHLQCRRSADAWRPLGYVCNEDVFFSGPERTKHTPAGKSLRLHKILDCILESFKAAQQPGALSNSKIQLGRVSKIVNLYIPLQFIIGDVEGGDQLTSRYHYRLKDCNRICRTCDVSTANCNRSNHFCKRIKVATIKNLYLRQDLEALKNLCQRHTYNTFYDIDCGKDPYGIFSMVHTEGLHALEVGIMKYMMEVLMSELPKTQHANLDGLVKKLNRFPNQHGYNGFPRCIWLDGVTTLAKLTGDQRVGKMFAVLLVALTEEGKKFFTKYLPGGNVTWERMVYCFQQMLCYWAWLKQDHYWMVGDMDACIAATKSIRIMARQLQALWPRRKGLKWALTKLHEMFHVPLDIHRNGKHYNVHSGPQEHNHMCLKAAALKTQRQKHKLDLQTGERIVDRLILQRAFDRVRETAWSMDEDNKKQSTMSTCNSIKGVIKNSTKGFVHIIQERASKRNKEPGICTSIEWNRSRKSQILAEILSQKYVLGFLIDQYFQEYKQAVVGETGIRSHSFTLRCFTEYQRNGIVYRCHPKYRGDRPYYDWCYVNWDDGNGTVLQLIGRIHLFIETPLGELQAVVQSVDQTTKKDYGVFGTYWFLEHTGPNNNLKPMFHLVDVDSLGDHAMMIPHNDVGTKFIHIHDQSEWAEYFIEMPLPPGLRLRNAMTTDLPDATD
jgi:hypothetical protein